MDWQDLLSGQRPGEKEYPGNNSIRSRFEQDFDRIVFSHPFRKLQDKTQVLPLPEDDFVHNRLTHSLEVASVGRSLGKEAGIHIMANQPSLSEHGISHHDFGHIVAAAALAHDVGNPPFGHAGEDCISSFFRDHPKGQFFKDKVNEDQWNDLVNFEGNAQGFRLLTHERHRGLRLTVASLAAFTKYPRSSSSTREPGRKSQKKYGFFDSELQLFEEVAQANHLIQLEDQKWIRHPLAFLVEAADDICYGIIDLEDGTRLGLVPFETAKNLMAQIIGESFSQDKLDQIQDFNEKLGTLRAMTIYSLVRQTVQIFTSVLPQMLDGQFDKSLTSQIPSAGIMAKISELSVQKIYRSKQVLKREAFGYAVIENLLTSFCESAHFCLFDESNASARHHTLFRLIPENLRVEIQASLSHYSLLRIILDYVSGLTDSGALRLHRIISGQGMT